MAHAPTPDPLALLDTVVSIYAAPGSHDGWHRMMAAIGEVTGSLANVYLLVDSGTLDNEINAWSGFSEADRLAYEGPHGAAKDIRFQYLHNLLPGQVFREFEYVTDRAAWDASEWIDYQRRALGCYWCLSAQVSTHGLWRDYISVNRLERLGPHSDQEKASLQALLPHIARAAELHRTLTGLEQRFGAVLAVLDELLIGLAIVDAQSRLALANAAAQALFDATGVLRVAPSGRLRAADSRQQSALDGLIAGCAATAEATGLCDGGSLMLTRGRQAVLAEVVPLRTEGLSDGDGLCGAAIFLIDPGAARVVSVGGLARLFGLTRSETDVTAALVNGRTPGEIADERRTALETVRKQLKTAFAKTGARSQLDLLRMAAKLTPPIRSRQ